VPAPIATIPESPATCTGVLRFAGVPSPTWPVVFWPQPHTVPFDRSASEWNRPAATAVTPVRFGTGTGVNRVTGREHQDPRPL
jgi:hypothetical protein